MNVSRRDFLEKSAAAAVAAATVPTSATAVAHKAVAVDRTAMDHRSPIPAPPGIASAFAELLAWLEAAGWGPFLASRAGFDLGAARREGDEELLRPLRAGSFDGFAGVRAIQPGDPAMSMLYHALASPDVIARDSQTAALAPAAYPSLEQIDLLENYIYARAALPEGADLELAMFAYEYRPAAKTPHGRHADLVFARTGVARTGTHAGNYDRRLRSFANGGFKGGAAVSVIPARFGLFLARRQPAAATTRFGINSRDKDYDFLVPMVKLFDGCAALQGRRLDFAEAHRDEKLARMSNFVPLAPAGFFDTNAPPFTRRSASITSSGRLSSLPGHDTSLVTIEALVGSVLVTPTPHPLVVEARQAGRRCGFVVPAATGGVTSNRRYSTLRLLQKPWAQVVDFGFSDLIFRRGRYTTGFRSPRNGPVFANIRHKVDANDQLTHIGNTPDELGEVAKGGYVAQMFVDGLCDGCIVALISDSAAGKSGPAWLDKRPLPAFSIVAAPDFFPLVDPIDLEGEDSHFLEGGAETASGGRLPANPHIPWPGHSSDKAFPVNLADRISQTVSAVVSAPSHYEARDLGPPDRRTASINTLPDTVSFVFAPGWDVTYSSNPDGFLYYATFGLGSPFPEDMKLCAAANGMWAGSSPDAARTFFPDLAPFPILGRPATAVPLLDDELGYHPQSPAVRDHGAGAEPGWDGEHGPYVVVDGTKPGGAAISVNHAAMMLSDYVLNARRQSIDLDRLAGLSADVVRARIRALDQCIRGLPGTDKVRSTELWLVSAEEVDNWSIGARGWGLPLALGAHDRGRIAPAPGISGQGWLYVFAKRKGKPSDAEQLGRRVQRIDKLYACQVTPTSLRYAVVDSRRPGPLAWG